MLISRNLRHAFKPILIYILKGAVIESTSGDQPSVTVTFERTHLAVKAYAVLNILNLLIMVSPDKSGNYVTMFYSIISRRFSTRTFCIYQRVVISRRS